MKAIILKVKPGTQFRLGDGNKDNVSSIIHSDTLFSALTNIYELVFNEGEKFTELVNNSILSFSSCFPCIEIGEEYIFMLPKPSVVNVDKNSSKKYKKIEFVTPLSMKQISDNIKISKKGDYFLDYDVFGDERLCVIGDRLLAEKDEIKIPADKLRDFSFLKVQTTPKNKARFEVQEDTIYYEANTQLSCFYDSTGNILAKTHYYFLLKETLDLNERNKFHTILNILTDEGLGGERSAGKGIFEEILIKDFNFEEKVKNNIHLSLSMITPASDDEFKAFLSYDIVKRGGGSIGVEGNDANERKQVRMIKEGAILNRNVNGRIVDVSPENNFYKHKIFRNGKSFIIP